MKQYNSLVDALDDLKKRGYDAEFEPQSDCLYCSILDLRLTEEEFHVDEVYRFVGCPNSGDNAVVYAFTSPTGIKGTIVDASNSSSANDTCGSIKK